MFPKTSLISYPGEMPDISHHTISLRTQLRLSYETYAWLRYVCWTGLVLLGILLFLLPGGFPPSAFVELWQMLPVVGRLLAMHGSTALLSLGALLAQALTWFILWALYLLTFQRFARYTWRLYRSQAFFASGWQPSTSPGGDHWKSSTSSSDNLVHRMPPASPPAQSQQTTGTMTRPTSPEASSQTRQFAQPSMPVTRTRTDEFVLNSSPGNWPHLNSPINTGVAWDAGISRKGRPNEDSILTMRGTCNFGERLLPFELHIIADGMGGHAHGRLASHLAIRGMLETVVPGLVAYSAVEGEQVIDILIDGVHWANQVIFQYGQEHHIDLGTTITAVLLLDETAYIINVGDSRTYVYRPGAGLTQITRDHSLVARLVETGAIQPDDVYTHPDRNKVYRGLGDKIDVTVDWFVLPVQVGDLFLLCSDGLWEMVRDRHMTEILQTYASAPALASHALLRAALQAGGVDNVSLLVARVQP